MSRAHRSCLPTVRWKAFSSILAIFAAFPCVAAANSAKPLCNEGGTVCVDASLANSLVANPLTVNVQVNSPGDMDLDWELRDSSGNVLDLGSTEDRFDWPGKDPLPRRTLHIMDFILRPAGTTQGTLILSPTAHTGRDDEAKELPQLTIPVRLSTARSVVTILEPEDPNHFHDDYYNWANTHLSSDPTPYITKIPFTAHQIEVMYFERKLAVGMTAAVVINRYQGESPWYLTHWSLVGNTAHVGLNGCGWSGVSNYVSLVNYVLRRSMLSIPGVADYVFDRPN